MLHDFRRVDVKKCALASSFPRFLNPPLPHALTHARTDKCNVILIPSPGPQRLPITGIDAVGRTWALGGTHNLMLTEPGKRRGGAGMMCMSMDVDVGWLGQCVDPWISMFGRRPSMENGWMLMRASPTQLVQHSLQVVGLITCLGRCGVPVLLQVLSLIRDNLGSRTAGCSSNGAVAAFRRMISLAAARVGEQGLMTLCQGILDAVIIGAGASVVHGIFEFLKAAATVPGGGCDATVGLVVDVMVATEYAGCELHPLVRWLLRAWCRQGEITSGLASVETYLMRMVSRTTHKSDSSRRSAQTAGRRNGRQSNVSFSSTFWLELHLLVILFVAK